jgi:hypothetical protein
LSSLTVGYVKEHPTQPLAHYLVRFSLMTHRDLFTILSAVVGLVTAETANAAPPVFETDVLPIVSEKCGKCHAERVRKGDLNLSSMAGLHVGGESGESLIAENPDDSFLWMMIDSNEMPPQGEPPLTNVERDTIRQWLEAGAMSDAPQQTAHQQINQHDVIPILLLRCTACHGARLQEGGVDLRSTAGISRGGPNGPIIVPGDPDKSLMIQRIESEACPPQKSLLKFFVKRPPASEVQVLRDWIAAGARNFDVPPDVATTEPDVLVTDTDRQHWAFQPPQKLTECQSIDDFIGETLAEHDLTFSPEADRNTLIRRVFLDLTGLPPEVDTLRNLRSDQDPQWYEKMVDSLLASPHYGERWGRYWLDVAGYADSEGGVTTDPVREVAWKYRDYVIDAFNSDKPYDQFLLEQVAGDELLDHESADVVTEQMVQNLVATGFLRMGIDQTGSRTMNFVPERLGVISDVIGIVGSGVMGLTLKCARCHSHKYDPIPHRDYYRFKAVFQGALDEHDWLSFRNRSLKVDTPERMQLVARVNPPLESQLKRLQKDLKQAIANVQLTVLRHHYPSQSDADRTATLKALRLADNVRNQTQRRLVENLQTAELIPDEQQPKSVLAARQKVAGIEKQILEIRRQMVPPTTIRALWDRSDPSPTYILRRGDHDKPGRLVGPGVPSVLTDGQTPFEISPPFPSGTPKTGRRLAFARWLTSPNHPLTARVLVNRVWHHHFGIGLVESLGNFGIKGDRPSHPELLDGLAVEFIERGWSIKELHRLIMNSRTYRQSSKVTSEKLSADPANRLLSRMTMRRMDAEALRDSLLVIAGRLENSPGGPPDTVTVDRDGLVSVIPTASGNWRRSVYLQYRRTEIPSLMATFDYPEMGPNCLSRSESTVSPQSLMLMNNRQIRKLATAFAQRILTDSSVPPNDLHEQVATVYDIALTRPPTEEERLAAVSALRELTTAWQGDRTAAMKNFCHAVMNSAAFLYVD